MKISTCIITDNNPDVMKAIRSVYNLSYEIILVNTVDEFTIDLTGFDKVKVWQFKWCNDFSKARNFSLRKAKGDWIFVIDSDEVLKNEFTPNEDFDYYSVWVHNEGRSYKSIRLWKNHLGIRYKNKIHETVDLSVKGFKGRAADIDLVHSGYEITDEEKIKKAQRNFDYMLEDKNNIYRNAFFCKHYFNTGEYQKALEFGEKALQQQNINADNKAILCNLMYDLHRVMGYGNAGIDFLRLSIEIVPKQVTARYMLVNYLYSLNKEELYPMILKQLDTIGSLIFYRDSDLSNEIYCDINLVTNLINTIKSKGAKNGNRL